VLTVGSLFSGIGGFDLGLERAGMRTVWFCEQDEFCRRVLAKHWPGVPCHPDVRALVADTDRKRLQTAAILRQAANGLDHGSDESVPGGRVVPVSVPYVDVLCGGFPCQGLSWAGLGRGLDDERSGLWFEMLRVIRELRPRWVVVENVAALLARGVDVVLGGLAACGYDAEWDCIPASAVGAPHRRDRIWLVAYPNASAGHGSRTAGETLPRPGAVERPGRRCSCDAGDLADSEGAGLEGTGLRGRSAINGGAPCDLGDSEGDGRGSRWARRPDPAGSGEPEPERPLQDADGSTLQPWRVGGRIAQAGGAEWWSAEPPVGRVAHGVPDRLDQLAALGNALVPQIAEWLGRRILECEAAMTTPDLSLNCERSEAPCTRSEP
jgi:DNA (cytosine-5)-methyltransferase 1